MFWENKSVMNLKKIFSNTIWMVAEKLIVLLANFFVFCIIANYYGSEKYGSFQYAFSLATLVCVFMQFIDDVVAKKKIGYYSARVVVMSCIAVKLALSFSTFLIGLLMSFYIDDQRLKFLFFVLIAQNCIYELPFGIRVRFENDLKSKVIVLCANVTTVISCICQFFIVKAKLDISYIAITYLAMACINLFLLVFSYTKQYEKLDFKDASLKIGRELLIGSLGISVSTLASTLYSVSDSIMLENMLGSSLVGVYSSAVKFNSVVQIAMVPIATSLFPQMRDLYMNSYEEYEKKYIEYTTIVTWISIIGVIVANVLIGPFINVFFNEEYGRTIGAFRILSVGSIFMYNAFFRSSHYVLQGKTFSLMWITILGSIINLFLNYFLISFYNINGAAIATALTQFFTLFVLNFVFKNEKIVYRAQRKGFDLIRFIKLMRVMF